VRWVFKRIRTDLRERIEFGDALMFLYLLVFVRQYLWLLDNNSLAWALSVPVTVVCWYWYVTTKQFPRVSFGSSFWLVVGLPLLLLYLLRAGFPDQSFDVLSYHLLHAERSLRGPLFGPGDFFPTSSPFNPAPDTLFGIVRTIFGFRLGTALNLLVLIWAAQIADRILRPLIKHSWLRAVCVMVTALAESFLFEISTYMVELLALPLLLEATFLTLNGDSAKNRGIVLAHSALLLGASTAFKFTNLAVVLPLVVICIYKSFWSGWIAPKRRLATVLLTATAFFAPLVPFGVYMYRLTGNPIFPIANIFFKSPYWPTHGGWDARWGPMGFWQSIAWPILVWFRPERHSELALYAGRLSLGFIAAFVGLILGWRNVLVRTICLLLITSSLLWSATALGYSRYGLYQELLAGVTIFAVVAFLSRGKSESRYTWKTALASLFCVGVATQAILACSYAGQKEWGGRNTILKDPGAYARDVKFMLRDRTLTEFLGDKERALFNEVFAWMETCPQSTGFQTLLKPTAPIIAARQPEYFFTRESRRQFVRIVEELPQDKLFTLCLREYSESARQAIAARGLELGRVTPVEIPFFSPDHRIGMTLIEILRPRGEARQKFQSSWMNAAFPDYDYREEIIALNAPGSMRAGEKTTIRFTVKNIGHSTWPSVGNKEGRYQVNIGDRWLTADGATQINELDGRTGMPKDLEPGQQIELPLNVTAPQNPGEYILEIDMVHEGVTWFYERGARPLRLRVQVAP